MLALSNNQYGLMCMFGLACLIIGIGRVCDTDQNKWGWFILAIVLIGVPFLVAVKRSVCGDW